MLTVERSDEGVSAQCEKLADISDFTFDYDLIDGQSAAGKCVARRVHYQNCQRTLTCSSRFRAVLIEA